MRALRLRAIARRLLIAVPFALLAAGVTLALGAPPASAPVPAPVAVAPVPARRTVVVPDLRRQAYVFARGILLDAGFAWTVDGATQGYPANIVVRQTPAPGTRIVATGAPTIRLQLAPNPHSSEVGDPLSGSPYSGTEAVTPAAAAAAAKKQAAEVKRLGRVAAKARQATAAQRALVTQKKTIAAKQLVAAKKAAAAERAAAAPSKRSAPSKHVARLKRAAASKRAASSTRNAAPRRPAAFAVTGAPQEPVRELPLPARARLLARWIAHWPPLTVANRHRFLFQHAWVVTGARFGWWRGAEALRILVVADRQLERQWRFATAKRAEAERALVEVRRRSAG